MADPQGGPGGAAAPTAGAAAAAAAAGAAAAAEPTVAPLIREAMRKAAVAWVAAGPEPARLLWCLPVDDALYIVTGPGEQQAPGLAGVQEALVTLRGDHGGRILTWPAAVSRVDPASDQWETVAPQLAAKRLNAPEPAADLVARWAAECTVSRLVPAGAPVAAGATLPDGSLAEPPRDTPARRRTANPFRLHRVR